MPLLKATAPELALLKSKDWEVTRSLPDVSEIYEAALAHTDIKYLGTQYALDATYIWQESSQMALGGVLQSVGMPVIHLFKDIVLQLDINVKAEVVDKLVEVYSSLADARQAMASAGDSKSGGVAMETGVNAGIGGLAAVNPYAAMIVKIVWKGRTGQISL